MPGLKKLLLDNIYIFLFTGLVLLFFYPVFLFGKIPMPADTIVGMYHPWRDKVWDNLTAGVPYKNFLITDPVRQQYVWRNLAINEMKKGQLPLWNPYSFSGTPLLANFQSSVFYPLNILYFFLPLNLVWTLQVTLQPLLAACFLYLYLRCIKVSKMASFLGGITFAFGGFSIAWLEWNTVIQVILWLPLILLAKEELLNKITARWVFILIFAEVSQIFAGHLQVWLYSFIISNIYLKIRIWQKTKYLHKKTGFIWEYFQICRPFLAIGLVVIFLSAIQWLPTLQFILHSARDFDQGSFMKEGWFIPWQNLVQFLVPDFFGNPATGNYWGVWNYGEFIGFIGVVPLLFAVYALISRRDKKTLFFGTLMILSLIFALPTPLAKLPYQLGIPLISTSQPTRLLFVTDFVLSVLVALGFDSFWRQKSSMVQIIKLLAIFGTGFAALWLFVLFSPHLTVSIPAENILIAKKNLVFPSLITTLMIVFFLCYFFLRNRKHSASSLYIIVVFLTVVDLFRFGWKFTSFSKESYIFPQTGIISDLVKSSGNYRIMAADRRIMPPNFSVSYALLDVSGYDPLYLKNYGQLAAAWERGKPDIAPAAFNRIITPANYESFMTDLVGVKYVLSINPLQSTKLEFILKEGTTYLYANRNVFPRAFWVGKLVKVENDDQVIDKMFGLGNGLLSTAVTAEDVNINNSKEREADVKIITYTPNLVKINVKSDTPGMLILTDVYYPTWKAYIDGKTAKIYKVDFAFRGILIDAGQHTIDFQNSLL